ncbi:inositol 2-dehydrogenase [Fuchsiella alkaliacetigena]|uniref:inositol 2-dehydrogenase n=1 Tax=Fuchsiella alkaliacetigena TaxID=957042 RepID=UPI00200B2E18|nr:inositol 2-dehydrogenase [Fuchsiella alkaliacetigena]MCK8824216.1 inositol 2-dehydrogenase [Fuchsiella alkaliacetigena]
MDKVRVGVIGMGRQGKIHSKNLAYKISDAELVCVAEIYLDEAKEWAEAEGLAADIDMYKDYRQVLEREDVDAVIVASSTDTHAQVVKDACKAQKDILCEKPIAPTLEEIDEVLEIVEESGVKFMVAFNRRFDPTFSRVREHVENGNVGQPHIVNITSRDPEPPHYEYLKVCGGIFFDTTVHDFDMARYLSGDEIVEVYATGSVLVDEKIGELGDLDTTMLTLKFKSGAVGSINNSRETGYSYDQRVEVFGSKGCAVANNETPNRVELTNPEGTHKDVPLYFNIERYPEAFLGEAEAFVKAVKNDEEPPVTGEDGRIAVVLSMAAQKSYEENRPVKIEEIG